MYADVEAGGVESVRYLWSVFVRELAHAAIAVDDRNLAAQLLDDLRKLEPDYRSSLITSATGGAQLPHSSKP